MGHFNNTRRNGNSWFGIGVLLYLLFLVGFLLTVSHEEAVAKPPLAAEKSCAGGTSCLDGSYV